MAASRIIGLDVGGTQVKGGWIGTGELPTPDPAALEPRTRAIDTALERGVDDLLDRLVVFANELGFDGRLGVGVPGVFDARTGELQRSANMHALEGLRLEDALRQRLGSRAEAVVLDNDANAAAFGEQWLGAGTDVDDLILLTLGTGVGGGVVLDGEVFRGPGGRGGEIGHLVVRARDTDPPEEEGLRCGCGWGGDGRCSAVSGAAWRCGAVRGGRPGLHGYRLGRTTWRRRVDWVFCAVLSTAVGVY